MLDLGPIEGVGLFGLSGCAWGSCRLTPAPYATRLHAHGNANGFASVLGRDVDALHACDMTIRFENDLAARLASPLAFCLYGARDVLARAPG